MRIIQWNFYCFCLVFGQFYPHNFHIWWFHLFFFDRIQVLWCYCHNTIKKLWIRPSIEEIWAKNEVKNCPPVPEKHLLSTLLSSISPHLKVRRFWMLFYQFLHPWYSIRTFIEKSKITLTLFYIGLRSARAQSPTFYSTFGKLSEGNSFYPQFSLIWALTSSTSPSIPVWSIIYMKCARNEGKFKQIFHENSIYGFYLSSKRPQFNVLTCKFHLHLMQKGL